MNSKKIIPEGWKKIRLKEVLNEVSERNKDENIKRVLSVTNSQGFVNQAEYFEGTVHSNNISNYKIIRKNQFAYNPSRVNVGSIDILKDYDVGVLSPMYVIFETDRKRLLPEYFKYYFQTHRFFEDVNNNTQGSVRNSLSFKALADFEYLLPPIEEQKKMLIFLNIIEKIIKENINRRIQKEEFKKYYLNIIFNNKKLQYEKKMLQEILEFHNGINTSSEKYGSGIKYISVIDILNNMYINYDNIKGLVDISEEIQKNYKVAYGDVVFVRSSENLIDAGKSNVYLDKEREAVFGGFVIRGKKKGEYNPLYLKYALETYGVRKQIMKYAAGNQHINIGQEALKKINIPYINMKYQDIISKFFISIDKEIQIINKTVYEYEKLKKGLMQKLLTGKVRVKI